MAIETHEKNPNILKSNNTTNEPFSESATAQEPKNSQNYKSFLKEPPQQPELQSPEGDTKLSNKFAPPLTKQPYSFSYLQDIAVDPAGNIIVEECRYYNDYVCNVLKLNENGGLIKRWGYVSPNSSGRSAILDQEIVGIAVSDIGDIYVADPWGVEVYTGDGIYVRTIGNGYGTADVAVSKEGIVYVADPHGVYFESFWNTDTEPYSFRCEEGGTGAIRMYSSIGELLGSMGGIGTGDGEFAYSSFGGLYNDNPSTTDCQEFGKIYEDEKVTSGATAVAVDSQGNIYAADYKAHRVIKFSSSGIMNIVGFHTELLDENDSFIFGYPEEVDVGQYVYVYTQGGDSVVFNKNGVHIKEWVRDVAGSTVDDKGFVYTTELNPDTGRSIIKKYNKDGNVMKVLTGLPWKDVIK